MIKIIVNTEGNIIRVVSECNTNSLIAKEEFKVLNKEFPKIRDSLLKKFPLFIQAEILADMVSDLHNYEKDEEGEE